MKFHTLISYSLLILATTFSCGEDHSIDTQKYLRSTESPTRSETSSMATLRLQLSPIAGAVYLDNNLVGTAAAGETLEVPVTPGLHSLQVSRSGYHDHTSKIAFGAKEVRAFVVRLRPLRRHLVKSDYNRQITMGMTARGAITDKAPLAQSVFDALKVKAKAGHEKARAVVVDLIDTPETPFRIRMASFGSRLHVYIVDDLGNIIDKSLATGWSPRMRIVPKPNRKYRLILAHASWAKNDAFNLVRYVVHPVPVVAKKKN